MIVEVADITDYLMVIGCNMKIIVPYFNSGASLMYDDKIVFLWLPLHNYNVVRQRWSSEARKQLSFPW